MIENFDDILPPQKPKRPVASYEPAPQMPPEPDHSIRALGIESDTRMERRAKRAERRPFVPEGAPTKKNTLYWALGIIGVALVLVVFSLLFFVRTTVMVTPHEESLVLANNVTFTAYTEPEGDELGFTTEIENLEKSTTLTASKTTYVERYASGVITVRNNFDGNNQRLIKNTRFESPDGKIYRVRNSITVPGKKGDTPGTIDVTVYADVAGDSYNMNTGTFTIPGLKGDPRFDAFSATIKTPITGGFMGNEPSVDETELERTRTALRAEMQTEMLSALRARTAPENALFDSLAHITYESSQGAGENNSLVVTERGTLSMPVFNKTTLTRTFIESAIASAREGAATLESYDALTVARVGDAESSFIETGVLQFTVSGETKAIWNVDTEAFARELAGKHQSSLSSASLGHPGIKKVSATIRPFWKTSFPSDEAKIIIKTERE